MSTGRSSEGKTVKLTSLPSALAVAADAFEDGGMEPASRFETERIRPEVLPAVVNRWLGGFSVVVMYSFRQEQRRDTNSKIVAYRFSIF